MNREKINSIDFLKLDCEGAEYEILFKCPDKILNRIKIISMEYHEIDKKRNKKTLIRFLKSKGFKVISGDTKIQTQQKIIDTLNMDYDTFINSAFLRQGHADEFTKQPPAKRKEVLANILGLSLYDRLEERAKELISLYRQLEQKY